MLGGPVVPRETGQGLDNKIGAPKGPRFDAEANTGCGFSRLALPRLQAGPGRFQRALGAFRDRSWYGVRSLVQAANQFAFRLEITAVVYAAAEDYLTRFRAPHSRLGMVVRLPRSW